MAATSPQVVFCGAYRQPVSQRQVDPGQDPKSTVDTDFLWETGQHQWADRRTLLPSIPSFPQDQACLWLRDSKRMKLCVALAFRARVFQFLPSRHNLLRDVPNPSIRHIDPIATDF